MYEKYKSGHDNLYKMWKRIRWNKFAVQTRDEMKLKIEIEIDVIDEDNIDKDILLEEIEEYCWSMDNQVGNTDIKNVSCVEDSQSDY